MSRAVKARRLIGVALLAAAGCFTLAAQRGHPRSVDCAAAALLTMPELSLLPSAPAIGDFGLDGAAGSGASPGPAPTLEAVVAGATGPTVSELIESLRAQAVPNCIRRAAPGTPRPDDPNRLYEVQRSAPRDRSGAVDLTDELAEIPPAELHEPRSRLEH